jgi:hypothetical protein
MSYIASKLKYRIQIMQAIDEPKDNGSFKRSYKKIIRLWAWKKPTSQYIMAIRSVNAEKGIIDTDEFGVRYNSVVGKFYRGFAKGFDSGEDSYKSDGLGKSFDGGFDNGQDSQVDIYPIKSDYFVFLENGNTNQGRLYKINRVIIDDDNNEFVIFRCMEIEEQGTGAKI